MGYGLVDELAAVVGVKAADGEGELPHHGGQHGIQPSFADAGGGAHDLPLRDLIDGVDVVDAFGSRSIALMHGINPQIARSALRVGPPALADAYRRRPGLGVVQATFPVALLVAQVVQVSHGEGGQPLVLRFTVVLVLALENPPGGRSAQGFVGLIDGGQQFDIGASIALWKAVPSIGSGAGALRGPDSGRSAASLGPGLGRSSSPGSAATSRGLCGLVWHIAVGAEPAPPRRKPAGDFRLRSGSLGWH